MPKPMTEQVPTNQPYKPWQSRWLSRGSNPTTILWYAGGGLLIAGIEWPSNWTLVWGGIGILLLAFLLERFTDFGKSGPVTLKEEVIYGPDGKVERRRFSTGLLSPGNLLRFVGLTLAASGLYLGLNWAMIITGFAVIGLGLYAGGQKKTDGELDSIQVLLPRIGDEIRSEKGYVIRRVEDGLRYSENGRTLLLRDEQLSIRYVESLQPDGSNTKRKVVDINAGRFYVHWDAPHEKEEIPLGRLFEISSHLGETLNSGKVS